MRKIKNKTTALWGLQCLSRGVSRTISVTVLAAGLVCASAALATQPPQDPAIENVNLTTVKVDFFDDFALNENTQLAAFSQVYISDPTVAFKKNWRRDHLTTTTSDFETKTAKRYAKLLKEQLTEVFSEDSRYSLVTSPAANTLTIEATIHDLDIYAPDSLPSVKQYVLQAGKATLKVSLKDTNGKTLATVSDSRETREVDMHTPQKTNSLLNERDFRFLMKKWAKQLAELVAKH